MQSQLDGVKCVGSHRLNTKYNENLVALWHEIDMCVLRHDSHDGIQTVWRDKRISTPFGGHSYPGPRGVRGGSVLGVMSPHNPSITSNGLYSSSSRGEICVICSRMPPSLSVPAAGVVTAALDKDGLSLPH